MCEEQRKQIAELIVEAIRRNSEKVANQESAADAEKNESRRLPMSPETKLKVAKLSDLTIGQLAAKYEKLFGEKCRSRNRRYVHRRIAWKLQADDEGGLSERAILRATVVAGESLIRLTPP